MSARRIRVAVAQLDYQPAFLGRSFSYLREPAILQETENGLAALVEFSEIAAERSRIREIWIDNIRRKLDAILYFCAVREADLVVFPEYSLPLEVLPACFESAKARRMVIIAGSHTVSGDEESRKIYEQIKLSQLNLKQADPGSDIRKSICPIFIPDLMPEVVEKNSKSVWEAEMTAGRPAKTLNIRIRGTLYKIATVLCIDALELGWLAPLYSGDNTPDLFIAPSLSSSTTPFENLSQLLLINEIPSIYVNGADSGNSKIFARSGTATPAWPTERDGTERLPKDAEAVIIADIDFDEQIEVRRTVRPHLGIRVNSCAPLLYPSHSDVCLTFTTLRKRLSDPRADRIPPDVRDQLSMVSRTDPMLFPALLQKKIRLLLDSAQSGSLRAEDIKLLLETVDIAAGVHPTFVLRQVLIQDALKKVTGLLGSPDSTLEQDRIFKVAKNIGKHRVKLPPTILEAAQSDIASSVIGQPPGVRIEERREPTAESAPFSDRQPDLNLIRNFVNSSDQGAFVVTGMNGIGKSALLRRVFLDVLPKWRCIWIQLVDGISFDQLVAECASRLDIPVNGIPSREEARHLAATVMSRIDLLDATGIVLDDCDSLLGPTGDFSDEETKAFLADLASKPSRRNAKVFLVSKVSLPLPQISQGTAMHRHLRGLEPQDTRNLLEYWIRLQGEELRGQPISIPEKLVAFLRGHPLAIRIAARTGCKTGYKALMWL